MSKSQPGPEVHKFHKTKKGLQRSLFKDAAVALRREVFLKSLFMMAGTSCIANCLEITLNLPPSSFRFIHQWEVAEGGSNKNK